MAFLKKKKSEQETENRTERAASNSGGQAKTGVLLNPHITEKTAAGASRRMYAFSVGLNANKIEIKRAIGARYGVTVTDVRVVNVHKKEMHRGKQVGWRGGMKKAYATLAEGQTIDIQ